MCNAATFTFHIRNVVKKAKDEMGCEWECSSPRSILSSHADTLEISCSSPTRVLMPALESMEGKRHASQQSYSMNVYIQNQWSTAVKLLGKTAQTQITLSPETPGMLYNYIYLEDNIAYGAKFESTMGHDIKTRNHQRHGTLCVIDHPLNRYLAQFLQENRIFKYLRVIGSIKTDANKTNAKFKF